MKKYLKIHPWRIIESQFNPEYNRISESNFSIGNGNFGLRGNFEEDYSGDSLRGTYIAGIYYPDKTRVGWWKNGYPEYFAKVLNAPNWIGIKVLVNGEFLDLSKVAEIHSFTRELDMQHGLLTRKFDVTMSNGIRLEVKSQRFCSLSNTSHAALKYEIKLISGDGELVVAPYLDGRVTNEDSNYDQKFWKGISSESIDNVSRLIVKTKKTNFEVGLVSINRVELNGNSLTPDKGKKSKKFVSADYGQLLKQGETLVVTKQVAIHNSLHLRDKKLKVAMDESTHDLKSSDYESMFNEHKAAWLKKWSESDIIIEGDDSAQQGIRFNIFQLNCTYNGEDERLNIGPKGFTGEKYGGSTYWDTEAYCLPFYQATAPAKVAKNLLIYRYKHLSKAIENAEKLGFSGGAALYPMVTMNGEECHNEWEITFEEIHRNGAIAYAIYDYVKYTGDQDYLKEYGLEVLIAISRFWSQRVNWSEAKQAYVILGVTGPNEFENNVNNNWYTNKMAAWCLKYTSEVMELVKGLDVQELKRIYNRTGFSKSELERWLEIVEKMYYPFSEQHKVFLQQDGFLDKELISASKLDKAERPIVEHWSWDRILRSCYIKQADVLQGFYFFEDDFDTETIKRHFDFYEPLTVHESSLSPCVHSIIAAKIGDENKAYEFYLRTSRLDLDDYNNDTRDGLHITSMAGTWMSVVKGIAGMRVVGNELIFKPFLPEAWTKYSFKIRFRNVVKQITIVGDNTVIEDIAEQ